MKKSSARRITEAQDAKARVFSLVFEITAEEYEVEQFVQSTFKKDGKFYVVAYTAFNPGQLQYVAQSRGYQGYKIIHTVGVKTPLNKGEFIS